MKTLLSAVAVALIFTLSVCNTLAIRGGGGGRDDYYPATKADVYIIFTGGGIYAAGDCDNGLGPVVGWLVIVPLHVIDLPISLVIDTLCLPFDAKRASRKKERQSRTFKMNIGVATTKVPALILLDTSVARWYKSQFKESMDPLWATFRCVESGETIKVNYGDKPFGCVGTTEKYKVGYFDQEYVIIEKQKQ